MDRHQPERDRNIHQPHFLFDPLLDSQQYRNQLQQYYSQVLANLIPLEGSQHWKAFVDFAEPGLDGFTRLQTLLRPFTPLGVWYIPPLGEIPKGQSKEEVTTLYQETKPGDLVSIGIARNTVSARMFFSWLHCQYDFDALPDELMQVHGVVLPGYVDQSHSARIHAPVFQRTRFDKLQNPPDQIKPYLDIPLHHIDWLKVTDAAFAFQIQTRGRISYGQDVTIDVPGEGEVISRAIATIDGLLIGLTDSGQFVTGASKSFRALPYDGKLTLR